MADEHNGLTATGPGRRLDPSWPAVAATTVRLWFERHSRNHNHNHNGVNPGGVRRQTAGRHRVVLVLSAIIAMAIGAVVTLAVTQPAHTSPPAQPGKAAQGAGSLQIAQQIRADAAAWIARQVLPGTIIACDPLMCSALEAVNVPAASLNEVQPSTPDPMGSDLVVATPAVRSQFGSRLASVYAPLVIASFGSGAQRIDIRAIAPDGAKAFAAALAPDLSARITAGELLLRNKNVRASAQASRALLAGDVDPRLLVTLSALAGEMPLQLVIFDDSSPGASPEVPLRGAEIGATSAKSLSAMLAFLAAQQAAYRPSQFRKAESASGQTVVAVQFDAPGPLGLNGP
jgi:hypothetical protein